MKKSRIVGSVGSITFLIPERCPQCGRAVHYKDEQGRRLNPTRVSTHDGIAQLIAEGCGHILAEHRYKL